MFSHQNIVCSECLNQIKQEVIFYCHSCGKSERNSYPLCEDCKTDKKYEDIRVFTYYYYVENPIVKLKFTKIKPLAKDLALLIKDDLQSYIKLNRIQNVLYIPLSKKVEKERGFNHLKEILKYAVPSFLVKDYLEKVKETQYQVRLKKEERFKNLKDAFSLKVDKIKGNTLIFDDILTTGATLLEIYNLIKDKVEGKIYAYTIAKG